MLAKPLVFGESRTDVWTADDRITTGGDYRLGRSSFTDSLFVVEELIREADGAQ